MMNSTPSLLDLKYTLSPEEYSDYLKSMGDLFWWEKGKFWVVTSHKLAKQMLTSQDYSCDRAPYFITRMPNLDLHLINDFFHVVSKMMVMSDPPLHNQRRRICYHGFSNEILKKMEPTIQQTVDEALTRCQQKGSMEFVEDIAKVLPSSILADFFHIPASERQDFYDWSNNMTQFFGGESEYSNQDGIRVNHSAKSLYDYFKDLMNERRKKPIDDFLSIILTHQSAFGLSDDEIISQAIMMLVAGQVTTTDQLSNNLYTLLSSGQKNIDTFKQSNGQLTIALNELTRLDPAVTYVFRVTKHDNIVDEKIIKSGDVIFISLHAVNRDESVFKDANNCLLDRSINPHLSFGFGPHFCIGAKLAQLEMECCFRELLLRFPNLKLRTGDGVKRKHHSLAFSGFERLELDI
jgi:cytochrome P450